MAQTFLVTGAGGQLGRSVLELLLQQKPGKLVATTRNPDKLADFARRGVEVRKADFNDPASLADAFSGADRLLLVSTDELAVPGKRLIQHRAAVAAAEKAGIKHVVYTSAPATHPNAPGSLIDDHFWTEQALIAAKLDWTILRNHLYTDLLLMGLPHAVATGQLFTATGTRGRNYVTREDCARTAAAALTSAAGKQILDVNGPAPVTQDEIAAIAGEVTGKTVTHIAVSPDDLRKGMAGAGLPPFLIDVLVNFDIDASRGYHAINAPTVKTLTGRDPSNVRAFLTEHRAALLAGH
ncbi:MAG TPA: NAD(P)H-binding protein [Dongiaceae bacterium]|jgi:NAD(P)H dehydrogenase (quinone)|nr:NAD(P)H-binding protein [Dongiaceae bacterium]